MKQVSAPHELDKLFDVEPEKTIVAIPGSDEPSEPALHINVASYEESHELEVASEPSTPIEEYDAKDRSLESQLEELQQKALEAYELQMVAAQTVVDKRHAVQHAEVAAEYMRLALETLKERNTIKDRKDKIALKKKLSKQSALPPSKVVNNNIITDRATLLKALNGKSE